MDVAKIVQFVLQIVEMRRERDRENQRDIEIDRQTDTISVGAFKADRS